jgi:hypothetical protein
MSKLYQGYLTEKCISSYTFFLYVLLFVSRNRFNLDQSFETKSGTHTSLSSSFFLGARDKTKFHFFDLCEDVMKGDR